MDVDEPSNSSAAASQVFFAKFLTNQKLLELQLSDSNFRRYVLLQFLILFQYLDSQVKFKAENYELKQDQLDWVKETTEHICKLIKETPPDGEEFLNAVKHILKREEQWSNWKNDGCKEFQKPKTPAEFVEEPSSEKKRPLRPRRRGKSLGDAIKDAALQGKAFMGNPELTKLWNVCPDNLEACRAKDRDFLPSLDSYFEEAIEQADPSAMVEESYKKVNDGSFGWRALRLLARRSPHFFTPSNNNISKLPEYLETMIKKIAKDRPSTGQPVALQEVESKVEVLDAQAEDNGNEEDELLKTIKEEENKDDEKENKPSQAFTSELLDALAASISTEWRKVATKLTFQQDEIDFFETQYEEESERARKFLQLYVESDDDASLENFAYMLEGLGMTEAVAIIHAASKP